MEGLPTMALGAMRRSVELALRPQTVRHVLARDALRAHFQPIVQLKDASIAAHESLIRGPQDGPLQSPEALFRSAREEGLTLELEVAAVRRGVVDWCEQSATGRLFLNLSAQALLRVLGRRSVASVLAEWNSDGVTPSSLVVEITEHEEVTDFAALLEAASVLRAHGLRFALDDFGAGRSSLRLWTELQPEFVKIDKYFVQGCANDPVKTQTLKGLTRFAEIFGTQLVAEGIETAAELQVARDLGIALGQGFFLGRPTPQAARSVLPQAARVIASAEIAVLPEFARAANADITVDRITVCVPPLDPDTPVDLLAAQFAADTTIRSAALIDDQRRPVGLINRQAFVDRYARPYFKELYGRKPCKLFADLAPLVLDRHTGLEGMTDVLKASDQRYLTEGFVVTEGGRYVGLGTGEQLVRVVTEARIEAARHANPLTFLPGNIPISEHIERLLASGAEFVACYADLNDFKPFNDHYGYWRGDEMIRLMARTIVAHCDARRDFVGHVGGDDFVVLFQSADWKNRCERIREVFDQRAVELFDERARAAGGIEAEDRHGVTRFFTFTTLAIGAVPVNAGSHQRAEEVASAAAAAKHRAKALGFGLAVTGMPRATGGQ